MMSSRVTCARPLQERAGFRAEDQELRGARAGAPAHPIVDESRRPGLARAGGGGQPHGVAHQVLGDRHLADELVEREHVLAGEERLDRFAGRGGRLLDDRHLVVLGQVIDDHVEHEAVELRLGQRIGAFHLDRVLRGQDEERLFQRIAAPAGRDLVLLHRLQQRGLRLGRRAVDLVGEDHVGEDRPLHEGELPAVGGLLEDLRAGDVRRHQVGRELDAPKFEVEDLRDDLTSSVFASPGAPVIRQWPPANKRDEDLLDHLLLADDHLAQFRENSRPRGLEFLEGLRIGIGGGRSV